MTKIYARRFFFTSLLSVLFALGAFAQIITIGAPDSGPYAPGSTIAVPFTVNDATACIPQNNVYSLVLSNAGGNFTPGTVIGTSNGFYTPFVNGKIPPGTPAGTYKVEIKTSGGIVSSVSNAFTISTGTGVVAGTTSQIIPGNPEVFGGCSGSQGAQFTFTPGS